MGAGTVLRQAKRWLAAALYTDTSGAMEFLIREGKRTVAAGRVTKILHLEENAARLNAI